MIIFSSYTVQYITQEYFRLLFAYESGHESVNLLRDEYAKLLKFVLNRCNYYDEDGTPDGILIHRFNTSHLYCTLSERHLEDLAYWQGENYSWTITNQEPSTSQDVSRTYVDDVFDYVTAEASLHTNQSLQQYVDTKERKLLHLPLYIFLKTIRLIDNGGVCNLDGNARYIVKEYCRVLIIEEGLFNNKVEGLTNAFSELIGRISILSGTSVTEKISQIILSHQSEIDIFYVEKHESLLNQISENNISLIEKYATTKENLVDTHRNQVDNHIDWAIKTKGKKIFDWS